MGTVLWVDSDRCTAETREDRGDLARKINLTRSQLDQVQDRVQVRWGPFGHSAEPSTFLNCIISR